MTLAAVSPAGALGGLGAPALDLASGSVGCQPTAGSMLGALLVHCWVHCWFTAGSLLGSLLVHCWFTAGVTDGSLLCLLLVRCWVPC